MIQFILGFLQDRSQPDEEDSAGQGLLEYALLLMLVAMVVLVLVIVFGGSVGTLFSNIVRAI